MCSPDQCSTVRNGCASGSRAREWIGPTSPQAAPAVTRTPAGTEQITFGREDPFAAAEARRLGAGVGKVRTDEPRSPRYKRRGHGPRDKTPRMSARRPQKSIALCRALQISPFGDQLEQALTALHEEAFADQKPRPTRLLARDGVVELVGILVD